MISENVFQTEMSPHASIPTTQASSEPLPLIDRATVRKDAALYVSKHTWPWYQRKGWCWSCRSF